MNNNEKRKSLSKTGIIVLGLAVLFALAVLAALLLIKPQPELLDGDGSFRTAYPLSQPVYPEMAPYPQQAGRDFVKSFDAWNESVEAQKRELSFAPELQDFFLNSLNAFLKDSEGENKLVSPLNIYMSLSMLAEISDGQSRDEILTALNCPDISTLRSRASDLWNANYRWDGATSLRLSNSLWLRDDSEYKSEAVNSLADNYYASCFQGKMGSDEYNKLLRSWLSEQSEGILNNSAQNESFDKDTAMALASCISYHARWADEFMPENTAPGIFHGASGDKERRFMHRSENGTYCFGEDFGAVSLPLQNGGGSMSFILPHEGVKPEDLLGTDDFNDYILSKMGLEHKKYLIINLAIPKFDVEASAQLKDGLCNMGIKSVFSQNADFSPICDDKGIYLSEAKHSVRVAVDEEGVSAAAYTLMSLAAAGRPPEVEIDFILDRPFIFIINSDYGQPLFAGIINEA